MPSPGFIFTGQSGCLLPMLIMFNLFFGKLIFSSTRLWLGIEVVLILLFIAKMHVFTRKISEQLRSAGKNWQQHGQGDRTDDHRHGKIIDVLGEVVE